MQVPPCLLPCNLEGSPAAAMHSSIGNVAAGTCFATMKSLCATGKLAWIMPTVGGAIGALVSIVEVD